MSILIPVPFQLGDIYSDSNPASLDLEYNREKLTGVRRALIPLSSGIKGEIPEDLMMDANDIIIRKELLKDRENDMII